MVRYEILWDGPYGVVVTTDETGCGPVGLTIRVTKDSEGVTALANLMVELLNSYHWCVWHTFPAQEPEDLGWYVLKVRYPGNLEEEVPGWWAGTAIGWLELPNKQETVLCWRLLAPEKRHEIRD